MTQKGYAANYSPELVADIKRWEAMQQEILDKRERQRYVEQLKNNMEMQRPRAKWVKNPTNKQVVTLLDRIMFYLALCLAFYPAYAAAKPDFWLYGAGIACFMMALSSSLKEQEILIHIAGQGILLNAIYYLANLHEIFPEPYFAIGLITYFLLLCTAPFRRMMTFMLKSGCILGIVWMAGHILYSEGWINIPIFAAAWT